MNRLDSAKRAQVVSCLVEGNSIRATVRMTGVAKNTVVKLLCDLGRACSDYQDKAFVNLKCRRLQCDEPDHQARHRADAGDVRHLLHPDPDEPSRRAGPRLFRRLDPSQPWRH